MNFISNYIDDVHQNYLELIDKYRDGTSPTEPHLAFIYNIIEIKQCCGFYYNNNLLKSEWTYFNTYFHRNCRLDVEQWYPSLELRIRDQW
ncbi:unnamed protein product [Adineta ricciae]|uniref:Uncharacterized protein n=1 Tax=Adineta ricciae TaxID=249248 RepID=A0A814IX99_ADIRI|nr:unnamed protein product [Adineta ricciae]